MCAVGATGGGRWFGMKYFTGDSALTIQMSKNTWKLRDGIRVAVTAQFDDHGKWSASAKGFHMSDGDGALEFTIPVKSIDTWVDEFKNSQRMIIRFPGQDIDDWQADLSGTENVTGPFGICIASVLMTN
ncbi:MAG: hypothetical protein KGJ24_00935 [Burkholderiales bacterium]|nr:hypothetical protein [Burkholderiales bacterium]